MFVLLVHVNVKPEYVEEFREATVANAMNSLKEPGIARFDFLQDQEDPTRFVLVEAYRTEKDNARHRETPHYKEWRARVEKMMAGPRKGVWHVSVFPGDEGW